MMNKPFISGKKVKEELVVNCLKSAGWAQNTKTGFFRMNVDIAKSEIPADFVLYKEEGKPVAVIEASNNRQGIGAGFDNASELALHLGTNIVFSTNGEAFYFDDGSENVEIFPLVNFPTPETLISRFKHISNVDEKIFSIIKKCVLYEEDELKVMKKGIFFMPELALVYQIGKRLWDFKTSIFGLDTVDVRREEKMGNSGINDLGLVVGKDLYVFEFKMRNKRTYYKRDIRKLMSFEKSGYQNIHKYFCAVIGENEKERTAKDKHRRMHDINIEFGKDIEMVGSYQFQEATKEDWYNEPIYPNICLWKVK